MEEKNISVPEEEHIYEEEIRALILSGLSDEELSQRSQQPLRRNRTVSKALKAYAQSVSSADKGGVRIIE